MNKKNLRLIYWILRRLGLRSHPPVSQPQLVMWYVYDTISALEPLPLRYKVRPFREGDQRGWADLLERNGQLGRWDLPRVEGELGGALLPAGQFFVECEERIVACAGVYDRQRNDLACWEIGWIASDPEQAGMRLGRHATAAAVGYALTLPKRPIYLLTDDHRVPALKTYLKVGFTPDLSDRSYVGRWQLVFSALGHGYVEYLSDFTRRKEVL